MSVITAKKSQEVLGYLLGRRSASVKAMSGPGPSSVELEIILQAGARVPDHGRAVPFYLIVFEGGAREKVGEKIAAIYAQNNPDADEDTLSKERARFTRAPVVIGVISRKRRGKHPLWEQILTAGAVCQNLLLAASSSGYGAQWLTEWYAYDAEFKTFLGLDDRDHIAGFIHIGTPTEMPAERERPDMAKIVTHWHPECTLNKGDDYDQDKFEFPKAGFAF
jgi:nitroreductase